MMGDFLDLKNSGQFFHKVEGWQDLSVSSEFFQGNALFLNRILGNPNPENMALGALVMDYDQACHLINLLDVMDRHMKFPDQDDVVKTYHLREAVTRLALFLQEVKIEKTGN